MLRSSWFREGSSVSLPEKGRPTKRDWHHVHVEPDSLATSITSIHCSRYAAQIRPIPAQLFSPFAEFPRHCKCLLSFPYCGRSTMPSGCSPTLLSPASLSVSFQCTRLPRGLNEGVIAVTVAGSSTFKLLVRRERGGSESMLRGTDASQRQRAARALRFLATEARLEKFGSLRSLCEHTPS